MSLSQKVLQLRKENIVANSHTRCPFCKTCFDGMRDNTGTAVEAHCCVCEKDFTIYRCEHCRMPFAAGIMGPGTVIETRCSRVSCKKRTDTIIL